MMPINRVEYVECIEAALAQGWKAGVSSFDCIRLFYLLADLTPAIFDELMAD